RSVWLLPEPCWCLFQVYGQGSGRDCRRHVQKLNSLQGEAEEAMGWTSCARNENPGFAAFSNSLVLQEGRAEVSRWSKYLDKDSEDQGDGEEEASTERQQFPSSQRKKEPRKQQRSFLPSDVQEYPEEKGVFQLNYQAKKHKSCTVAVPHQEDGDAVSGDSVVPAVCESILPEENTQTPTPCAKPSKWEKFLSCSDNCSGSAARVTLSPREGSGRLGPGSAAAADAAAAGNCSGQARRGMAFEFKKCVASTELLASKLPAAMVPSTSCSLEEDLVFKEPQRQFPRTGPGVLEATAGKGPLHSTRANTLGSSNTGPKPNSVSHHHLFCTGEEFDDDL
ncbi:MRNIP protein, partial [Urocolius indicus]|nr:MRNIP protein [Urocolius indicus]